MSTCIYASTRLMLHNIPFLIPDSAGFLRSVITDVFPQKCTMQCEGYVLQSLINSVNYHRVVAMCTFFTDPQMTACFL